MSDNVTFVPSLYNYFYNLFNRLRDCPEEGSSNPRLGSIISIVACEYQNISEYQNMKAMQSLYLPLPPSASTAKFPIWPIKEAVRH